MIVVGTGCGPGLLTEEAITTIRSAILIYGSGRAIELAREHISPSTVVKVIEDYSALDSLPEQAVVLSTGDPMLGGLGCPGRRAVPGISSMQVAFARLGLDLVGSSVLSAHGASHEEAVKRTVQEIMRGKTVFLLTEPSFPLTSLTAALRDSGEPCKVAVCEELGYPSERIEVGTPEAPPMVRSRLYSVVVGKW